MVRFELAALARADFLPWIRPQLGFRFFTPIERPFPSGGGAPETLPARGGRVRARGSSGALARGIRGRRGIHDEFSYLGSQPTRLRAGDIANPIHPMWIRFESFPHHSSTHVRIDVPPAHGAILAAAKVIAGPPWAGVWVAAAAMCAAMTWMLQGWFPPAWALLGGPLRLYGLRRSVTGSIPNCGGAHAAVRRALLLGGLPGITERPKRVWPPFSSRPASDPVERSTVQGFDVSAAAAYRAGVELVRNRVQPELVMRNVALPIVIALVVFMIAMGYYNSRVFGSPLTLPY